MGKQSTDTESLYTEMGRQSTDTEPSHRPVSEIITKLVLGGMLFPSAGTSSFHSCRGKRNNGKKCDSKILDNSEDVKWASQAKKDAREAAVKKQLILGFELKTPKTGCKDCTCINILREFISLTHCDVHKAINVARVSKYSGEKDAPEEAEVSSADVPDKQDKGENTTFKSRELSESEVEEYAESIPVVDLTYESAEEDSEENVITSRESKHVENSADEEDMEDGYVEDVDYESGGESEISFVGAGVLEVGEDSGICLTEEMEKQVSVSVADELLELPPSDVPEVEQVEAHDTGKDAHKSMDDRQTALVLRTLPGPPTEEPMPDLPETPADDLEVSVPNEPGRSLTSQAVDQDCKAKGASSMAILALSDSVARQAGTHLPKDDSLAPLECLDMEKESIESEGQPVGQNKATAKREHCLAPEESTINPAGKPETETVAPDRQKVEACLQPGANEQELPEPVLLAAVEAEPTGHILSTTEAGSCLFHKDIERVGEGIQKDAAVDIDGEGIAKDATNSETLQDQYGTATVCGPGVVTYSLDKYNGTSEPAMEGAVFGAFDDASYHFTSEEVEQINTNWPQNPAIVDYTANDTYADNTSPEPSIVFDDSVVSPNDSLQSQLTLEPSFVQEQMTNDRVIKRKPVNGQPITGPPMQEPSIKVPSIKEPLSDGDASTLGSSDMQQERGQPRQSLGGVAAEVADKCLKKSGLRKPASFSREREDKRTSRLKTTAKTLESKAANVLWESIPRSAKAADDLLAGNAPRDFKTLGRKTKAIIGTNVSDFKARNAELKGGESIVSADAVV